MNRYRGISLIELMIAMAVGLLVVLAVTITISRASNSNREVVLANRQIENGRYALEVLTDELHNAGYYGPVAVWPTSTKVPPLGVCGATVADYSSSLNPGVYISATRPTCIDVADFQAGSHVLLILRTSSFVSVAGDVSATVFKGRLPHNSATGGGLKEGRFYLQTDTQALNIKAAMGTADANLALFDARWQRRDPVTGADQYRYADIREFFATIFFVSKCNRYATGATSCTAAADDGAPVPTMKRMDLVGGAWITSPVAEGIEQIRFELGVDSGSGKDGAVDSILKASEVDALSTADALVALDNTVGVNLFLLARSPEKIMGHSDDKEYILGTDATYSGNKFVPSGGDLPYRRHVFAKPVRLPNVSARREP